MSNLHRKNQLTCQILLLLTGLLLLQCQPQEPQNFVGTLQQFNAAVQNAAPGDTITLANGNWENVELLFEASGTAESPIVLRAETPGKVVISGVSMLRIAGEHLVVSGLLFTAGHTPGNAVIEFRKDGKNVANSCRVTQCVIDDYNQPDRFKSDYWVLLYGKNNRFDHNYLANKKNHGVTLAVVLNDPRNQENNHRIDHNYFGYRPRLGSNGGETLRVGVSTWSLTSSNTIIEGNYFYRCNGETEVVSIKASDNSIRRNTFYECEGSLVMRHGNRNVVSENFFIGNNRPETGGIRVINEGHRIYNNYLYGLKGGRFRAALAVMNGVPNSLLNRYHKAKDCSIAHNTFVDCDNVEFGVGSDFERTDVPQNILLANNLFVQRNSDQIFRVLDDIGGYTFRGNVAMTRSGPFSRSGFIGLDPKLQDLGQGLWVPTAAGIESPAIQAPDFVTRDITGASREGLVAAGSVQLANTAAVKPYATPENTGADWYNKSTAKAVAFESGATIAVPARRDALYEALQQAKAGDILELISAETYEMTRPLELHFPLTIRAAAGLNKRPLLQFLGDETMDAFISLENGGSLRISGLAFDGNAETGAVVESAISTSAKPMIEHYNLFADNCEFFDFQESRHNAFRAAKSTFADTVAFSNCLFYEISGTALSLAAEKEDRGKYSAEYVVLRNCVFKNVMGAALDLYRGGNDESTFGPFLTVEHCIFDDVNNKEQGSVLRLIGVQVASITNSIFHDSGRGGRSVKFEDSRWNHVQVSHCNLYNSGKVESYYNNVTGAGMLSLKPEFVASENLDYRLKAGSALVGRGEGGGNIGIDH